MRNNNLERYILHRNKDKTFKLLKIYTLTAFVFSFQLVAVYDILKDSGKRQKYDNVLVNGLPNWRSAVYYYRHVRKMGLLEMSIILFTLITIGQYLVSWAAYFEKRYTYVRNALFSFFYVWGRKLISVAMITGTSFRQQASKDAKEKQKEQNGCTRFGRHLGKNSYSNYVEYSSISITKMDNRFNSSYTFYHSSDCSTLEREKREEKAGGRGGIVRVYNFLFFLSNLYIICNNLNIYFSEHRRMSNQNQKQHRAALENVGLVLHYKREVAAILKMP